MSEAVRTFDHPAGVHNATPPRVLFGPGSVSRLREEVGRLGARRALVVSTPGRAELAGRLAADIGDRCAGLLPEAITQVPIELAHRGRSRAEGLGADCLVSVGGGASTGLCKGIALHSGLPILAVPTTYAGSEMTGFCGMTIEGVKRMHESLAMRPRAVIYDAELSVSLPPSVSAASAMNALAHCIDAIYLPSLSPLLAPSTVLGAQVVASTLPALLKNPDDLAARNEMLFGAYLSGAALAGGFAIQHAVAHMLGGSFDVEHGRAHAVVLPYVTDHLVRCAPEPLGRIARALDTKDLPGYLWDLISDAGLPVQLADVGLGESDFERAAEIAAGAEHDPDEREHAAQSPSEQDPELHNPDRPGNPAPITDDAVRTILRAAMDGRRP